MAIFFEAYLIPTTLLKLKLFPTHILIEQILIKSKAKQKI